MISSQLHRAKQSTLPPGHPPATAPLTRSCLPTPTAAVLFASFQLLSPGFALPSPQYRPPNASRPRSTPQSTCLIPHSRSCTVGCHTSRDFVPWRFSDASCRRAWIAFSSRRPRNLNSLRHGSSGPRLAQTQESGHLRPWRSRTPWRTIATTVASSAGQLGQHLGF